MTLGGRTVSIGVNPVRTEVYGIRITFEAPLEIATDPGD